MNYLVMRHQKKGIPSILALFIIILFGAGIVFFIQKRSVEVNLRPVPVADIQLERTEVGNIRDNTITIYWRTEQPSKGYVLFGSQSSQITQSLFDDTETEETMIAKRDHVVKVSNLNANTHYYYYIVSDGKKVGQSLSAPFEIATTDDVNSLLSQKPIFGRLFTASRHIIPNAIVIVRIDGAEPLITTTKGDGTFALSPCCVKKDSLTEVMIPSDESDVNVEVIDENSIQKAEYSFKFLAENNEIYLGQPEQVQIAQKNGIQSNFLLPANLVEEIADVDITFPRKNAIIPDTKPLIKGVGEPGKLVKGKLEPDGKLFSAVVSDKGQWTHTIGTNLEPGIHYLEVETTDAQNKKIALSRTFTIMKSGEAVLGESTPSATLAPTEIPVTPSVGPTGIPTDFPLPTPEATITGLPSDMPTKPPPVTGSNIVPFATISIVLIMIGIGALLIN